MKVFLLMIMSMSIMWGQNASTLEGKVPANTKVETKQLSTDTKVELLKANTELMQLNLALKDIQIQYMGKLDEIKNTSTRYSTLVNKVLSETGCSTLDINTMTCSVTPTVPKTTKDK